ncbi:MAG: 4-amino-4-deoxy-L-arabinose transferase-like glycosyltransferase [Janthinobacterium sp.]|jgi:4-amino-4-deoxy-L-arabinose transferase-like glycosyltransferase
MQMTVTTAKIHINVTWFELREWLLLAALLTAAVGIRFLFLNGVFGSDDLVYLSRAVQISEGDWASANYSGSLRYGFNIPAGLLIHWFGINLNAAILWPLLCSIAEIAAVYLLALSLWGRRAALYAALILLAMPLHVAVATRIHADSVVSFFLTLSFVLFYFAEKYRSFALYFFTGIAMGLVFWSKEGAVVTLLAFFIYPLIWRKFEPRWALVIGGGLVMLCAHFALMAFVAGDPLHAFKVVMHHLNQSHVQGANVLDDKAWYFEDDAWYYFKYLLIDIKHVWLSGLIVTAALCAIFLRRRPLATAERGVYYVAFWLLSLLVVLSFMPVSLAPLKLVMKQPNYLTLLLAPMALIAGFQLARLARGPRLVLLIVTLAGGLLLAGLEQQAWRVFTSNSKAGVAFAVANPGVQIIGSINNQNMAGVYSILNQDPALGRQFHLIGEMPHRAQKKEDHRAPAVAAFAILDGETMDWGNNAVTVRQPPACWEKVRRLSPLGFGPGRQMTDMLANVSAWLPASMQERLQSRIETLSEPRAAILYRVELPDFWCEWGPDGA